LLQKWNDRPEVFDEVSHLGLATEMKPIANKVVRNIAVLNLQ
jgi:hypothetical protein